MTTSNILKTIGALSLSTVLLSGCAGRQTAMPVPSSNTTQDVDVNMMETTPESVEPTLSNSTEPDDLQKELDETVIPDIDVNDL